MHPNYKRYLLQLGTSGPGTVANMIPRNAARYASESDYRAIANFANDQGVDIQHLKWSDAMRQHIGTLISVGKFKKALKLLRRNGGEIRRAGLRDSGPGKPKRGKKPEKLKAGRVQVASKLHSPVQPDVAKIARDWNLPEYLVRGESTGQDRGTYGKNAPAIGNVPLPMRPAHYTFTQRLTDALPTLPARVRTQLEARKDELELRGMRARPSVSVMSPERKDELTGANSFAARLAKVKRERSRIDCGA